MPGAGGSAAFFALTETAHCAGRRCEAPIFKSKRRQFASPLLHRAATPEQSSKRPASRTPARPGSMSAPEPEELKHCPGCSQQKPLSMFHKNRSKYGQLPSQTTHCPAVLIHTPARVARPGIASPSAMATKRSTP